MAFEDGIIDEEGGVLDNSEKTFVDEVDQLQDKPSETTEPVDRLSSLDDFTVDLKTVTEEAEVTDDGSNSPIAIIVAIAATILISIFAFCLVKRLRKNRATTQVSVSGNDKKGT